MRRGEASIEISSVQVVDMVYMSTRNDRPSQSRICQTCTANCDALFTKMVVAVYS